MGAIGKLALTTVGYMVGGPLGAAVGMAIGAVAFKPATSSVTNPQQDSPNYETGGGLGSTLVAADIPVPICFGSTKLHGNIIKAYKLGERNERLLAAIALGEYIGSPDPTLTSIWVNDVQFSD